MTLMTFLRLVQLLRFYLFIFSYRKKETKVVCLPYCFSPEVRFPDLRLWEVAYNPSLIRIDMRYILGGDF